MKKLTLLITCCLFFTYLTPLYSETTPRRSIFVSVIQTPPVLSNRQDIIQLVEFAKQARIDTIFIQVYRANKSWFPSKVGDSEPYYECLKSVGEDPLKLLLKEAHASGIEVHAWLNLMSLSVNENAPFIRKYGTDVLTKNLKPKKDFEDYKIDNQYFLEPGDTRIREELSNMVGELVRTYPGLDGVQFDYIRYPDKNPAYGFTKINVERFKKATGIQVIEEKSDVWKNWKRAQVTELLKTLAAKARSINPRIKVSTTGLAPYSRAYHEAFQEWAFWAQSGLVDFVTEMTYSTSLLAFKKYVADSKDKAGSAFPKINIGIAAYSLVRSPWTFGKQFEYCEKSGSRGCAIFHYESLIDSPSLKKPLLAPKESASHA